MIDLCFDQDIVNVAIVTNPLMTVIQANSLTAAPLFLSNTVTVVPVPGPGTVVPGPGPGTVVSGAVVPSTLVPGTVVPGMVVSGSTVVWSIAE